MGKLLNIYFAFVITFEDTYEIKEITPANLIPLRQWFSTGERRTSHWGVGMGENEHSPRRGGCEHRTEGEKITENHGLTDYLYNGDAAAMPHPSPPVGGEGRRRRE